MLKIAIQRLRGPSKNDIKKLINDTLNTLYCCVLCKAELPSQSWSTVLESHICQKFKLNKISASECRGDAYCEMKKEYIEIKVSLGGQNVTKFNFVQLRPHHNIHSYLFLCYDQNVGEFGEYYYFKVPANEVYNLLPQYGGYAHGTIKEYGKITADAVEKNKDKKVEYALRPKKGDNLWNELLKWKVIDESKMFE